MSSQSAGWSCSKWAKSGVVVLRSWKPDSWTFMPAYQQSKQTQHERLTGKSEDGLSLRALCTSA